MMGRQQDNKGFSLIELIIVIAILTVLTGLFFMNPSSAKRREIDRYSRELCNQIRLMQTVSMAKPGQWRLSLYVRDGEYYCVQEKADRQAGEDDKTVWQEASAEIKLGHEGAVTYRMLSGETEIPAESGAPEAESAGGTLLFVWRFDRDTGACIEGSGTLEVMGAGKTKHITVYQDNGKCVEEAP